MYSQSASIVYLLPLLKHIDIHLCDKDTLNRMICRCIEYNLFDQLEYILSLHLDCNKELCLRKIGSVDIYLYAYSYGYTDIELNKRITWLQRRYRSDKSTVFHKYEGPSIINAYRDDKYYGYRCAIHRLRWDSRNHHQFYRDIVHLELIGNCEWEAYMDYFQNKHS